MNINLKFVTTGIAMALFTASTGVTQASNDDASYCMDVVIEPFHMMPDPDMTDGSCTVPEYWDGELQQEFYAFTEDEHLFNCEYFGPETPIKLGDQVIPVPSAVVSQGNIVGTIGGHSFEAELNCASLTNWYQDSCADPADPESCSFQLAQPFLPKGLPFPRVTEVSIFDGVITVDNGRRTKEVPVVMATRAAGITHLEDLTTVPPEVGASVTHSLLGMLTYEVDDDDKADRDTTVLDGNADLLLQGHIFSPLPVSEDPGAAVIKGSICSEDLYKQLNRRGGNGNDGGHHDDD